MSDEHPFVKRQLLHQPAVNVSFHFCDQGFDLLCRQHAACPLAVKLLFKTEHIRHTHDILQAVTDFRFEHGETFAFVLRLVDDGIQHQILHKRRSRFCHTYAFLLCERWFVVKNIVMVSVSQFVRQCDQILISITIRQEDSAFFRQWH